LGLVSGGKVFGDFKVLGSVLCLVLGPENSVVGESIELVIVSSDELESEGVEIARCLTSLIKPRFSTTHVFNF